MKNFELVAGNEKCVNLVKINGTTALAKDAKPSGKLLGIVRGTEVETGKETYYLCMNTDEGFKAIKAASAFKRSIGLIFYPTA